MDSSWSTIPHKKTAVSASHCISLHKLPSNEPKSKQDDKMIGIHPLIDNGLKKGDPNFSGGTLECHCTSNRVQVKIDGNVAHNHACGCSKCWKPSGALFSVVGVVPVSNLSVTANKQKLHVVDPSAVIQRNACKECGVHMYGRIEKDHVRGPNQLLAPKLCANLLPVLAIQGPGLCSRRAFEPRGLARAAIRCLCEQHHRARL